MFRRSKDLCVCVCVCVCVWLLLADTAFAWTNPSFNPASGGGSVIAEQNSPGSVIYIKSNGNVGIGNTNPGSKFSVTAGDNKDTGPIINIAGSAVNQFESGRVRLTESSMGATPFYQGAFIQYDGAGNVFNIGVHEAADALISSDINAVTILRSNGYVGIGDSSPSTRLEVNGTVKATGFEGPLTGTISSPNVSAGDFGANTGGGNYTFPGSVGIGATNPVGHTTGRTLIVAGAAGVGDGRGLIEVWGSGASQKAILQHVGTVSYVGNLGNATGNLISGNDLVIVAGGGKEMARILGANGNLGIGTTTPGQKLTVAGTIESTSGGVKFPDGSTQATAYLGGSQTVVAANVSSGSFGVNTGGGNYTFPADLIMAQSTNGNSIGFGSYDYVGAAYSSANMLLGYMVKPVVGSPGGYIKSTGITVPQTAIELGTNINFATKASDSNPAGTSWDMAGNTKMVILNNGNVGIGTTGPGYKLEVNSGAVSGGIKVNAATGYNSQIVFHENNAIKSAVTHVASDNSLRINNAGSDVINVTSVGNVGVGLNDSPRSKLDVGSSTMVAPAASGTANDAILRVGYIDHSWAGGQLDVGIINGGSYPAWIQVRNPADYSVNRNLLLNPNGGNVGIGTTTPTTKLDVNGTVKATAFEGPLSGTISSANVSSGAFGANTGGGNYTFPATVTATTFSGTLSGNATTATTATNLAGFTNSNSTNPVVGPDNLTNNGIAYVNGISLFGQTDGALFAQAYSTSWVGQIYQDYRTGQLAVRGKNNGTWQPWRTQLDSSNYTSYSPSLTGSGASGTWGIGISGNATNAYGLLGSSDKQHALGESSGWDGVGFSNLTNLHFQGHNQFWVGAGNSTWYTGAATASNHDLLITTMQSDATYTRGITFATDNTGAGNSGWRLGRWISGTSSATSKLIVDGSVGIGKTPTTALDVNGTITATGFSGPLTGTVSAANVSAGSFAANTGGGNFIFPGDVTVTGNLISGTGGFAREYQANIAGINNTTWTNIAFVNGSGLNSKVMLTMGGTTGNVVVDMTADIIVNHSYDIYVRTESGSYTQITLLITSDSNEDFYIQAKMNSVGSLTANCRVFTYGGEAVTMAPASVSGVATLQHVAKLHQISISSTGGDQAGVNIGEMGIRRVSATSMGIYDSANALVVEYDEGI